MLNQVKSVISIENLVKELSPRGNGKTIKSNKPKNGIHAYVWRMARFYGGIDTCIPMTANWDLHTGIEETFGVKYYTSIKDENGLSVKGYSDNEICAWLDGVAKQVLGAMGLGPMRLTVNPDETLVLTGRQNSMDGIAVGAMVAKVNTLDKLTLAIVYHGARLQPYGASIESWRVVKSGIDLAKLESIGLGELRKTVVLKNGGSINGSIDAWLDLHQEILKTDAA